MRKLVFLTVIYFLMGSPFSFADEGGVTSNGGDSIAAEFTKIGRQIILILRTQNGFPVTADQFTQAVGQTWVVSKERTLLHGQEMDAINYPSARRIEINRKRWVKNKDAIRSRYVLVAHEYFGILKVDDSRYQLSEKLFEIPGVAKHTIRCKSFADGVLNFGPTDSNFFLELNTYDTLATALVKSDKGLPLYLSTVGVGDTMITGTLTEKANKTVKAIISINLGFSVRMVQVALGRTASGKFTGQRWDVKADAQLTPVTDVECEQTNW